MAIWNNKEASNLTYLGLYAQQHRGQEGAGVVSLKLDEGLFSIYKDRGLVADVFEDFDFTELPGEAAIGHVRYTTAGGDVVANVQPFLAQIALGEVAIAHNGNLVNVELLRDELIRQGAIFSATSDTELLLHLMARNAKVHTPLIEVVVRSLEQLRGAYSIIMLFKDRLLAIRDPHGFRPLCLGELDGAIVVASETCAFDLIGAKFIRDVKPGEIVEISGRGAIKSYFPFPIVRESSCIFEYVYFARPDSIVYEQNVYRVRRAMGRELAKEHPVDADIVVPVPDSGMTAAIGYAEEVKLPLELGLIRNHYVGRTFIEPKQAIRDFGVKIKLNANSEVLKDKRVVVIDDSLVRGTTSRKLVQMLRGAGAKELHFRISSPPTTDPCYYGIDTPEKSELIASYKSIEEIREYLGADSIRYLSIAGLYRSVQDGKDPAENNAKSKFCDACFSGNYPVGTPADFRRRQRSLF
jgi:amidophosphoribosyltransferase